MTSLLSALLVPLAYGSIALAAAGASSASTVDTATYTKTVFTNATEAVGIVREVSRNASGGLHLKLALHGCERTPAGSYELNVVGAPSHIFHVGEHVITGFAAGKFSVHVIPAKDVEAFCEGKPIAGE